MRGWRGGLVGRNLKIEIRRREKSMEEKGKEGMERKGKGRMIQLIIVLE